MIVLGLPLLVLLAVLVAYGLSRATRGGTAPGAGPVGRASPPGSGSAPPRGPRPVRGVAADLARWVGAGLLSPEQSAAILAHEQAGVPEAPEALPGPPGRRRVPAVAEALGYLGGILAVVGLVLIVARYWPDMGPAGRLALSAAGALGAFAAGALVRAESDPAFARLRAFVWLASTALAALFAGVLTVDALDVEDAATVVLACSGAVALESGLLWQGRERPLQQLTLVAGVIVFAGALAGESGMAGLAGLAVWAASAAFVVAGLRRRMPLPVLSEGLGGLGAVVGVTIVANDWAPFGLPVAVASALALLAASAVPGVAPDREDEVTLGALGAVGLLLGAPSAVGYFSEGAGAVTGLVTWAVGAGLVAVGWRRLVRSPNAAAALGGVALIVGAAVTGVQWPAFAPLFGIAAAVGMVAFGMLPGQVLMSVFGSLGLLVNVPWAIGRFFPGGRSVPLLILVSGALILGIAVLLARSSDRFRADLGRRRPGGTPPAVAPGGRLG